MATHTPVTALELPVPTRETTTLEAPVQVRRWLALAVGSLLLAGLLALVLVIGRVPPLDALFTDPLFFRRALVVHVDLAMVVWFLGFFAALWYLLPTRRALSPLARIAPILSWSGILLMIATALFPGVRPVLANYVPVLDDPLYATGLVLFGAGLLSVVLDWRMSAAAEEPRSFLPPAARPGLRAAAVALLMAAFTFLAATWTTPTSLPADAYYEELVWGGGHLLQFVSVAAMLAAWLTLLTPVTGPPLSRRVSAILFGLLVLPTCVAPLLADTRVPGSRLFFTRLMELAIFPVVSVILVAALVAIRRTSGALSDARVLGFLTSALLAVTGFILGASIDGSNTMVPGHYHASIGAVTAAFMTLTHPLLEHLGLAPTSARARRMTRWQPIVFGLGQLAFAVGFGAAGAAGALRKTYGAEQAAAAGSFGQTAGLVVMGVGGLVAVVGGVLYLVLLVGAWRRASRRPPRANLATRGE